MYDLVLTEKVVGAGGKEIDAYLHLGEMQWFGAQCVGPSSRFRVIEPPDIVRIQLWKEETVVLIAEVNLDQILGIVDGKVIIYGVFGDVIVFIHVDHHDKAYAAAYEIAIIDDEGLLTTLSKVSVTTGEIAAFVESIGR